MTHIAGFLLGRFQLLLSILHGLAVLVQLILGAFEFLLQGNQVIVQLKERKRKKRQETMGIKHKNRKCSEKLGVSVKLRLSRQIHGHV